jgi:hypothetical protein
LICIYFKEGKKTFSTTTPSHFAMYPSKGNFSPWPELRSSCPLVPVITMNQRDHAGRVVNERGRRCWHLRLPFPNTYLFQLQILRVVRGA